MRTIPPLLSALALALFILSPGPARAHCDTLDGPVVTAARQALETGDVTPVLRWVRPEDEAEIRRAFEHVRAVRELGDEARALADRHFFETLVRIHRAAEGAAYTGLQPAGTPVLPAVAAADAALASGSADALDAMVTAEVEAEVRERFHRAREAQGRAEESVPAGRRFVAAYVELTHYVEGLHAAAGGHPEHDGEPPGSHPHR